MTSSHLSVNIGAGGGFNTGEARQADVLQIDLTLYVLNYVREDDDVIQWKHFPRYWSLVRGIHRSPVNSPHKGHWRRVLILSLICALNKRFSKQWWGWWFETSSCWSWCHCNVCQFAKSNSKDYWNLPDIRWRTYRTGCLVTQGITFQVNSLITQIFSLATLLWNFAYISLSWWWMHRVKRVDPYSNVGHFHVPRARISHLWKCRFTAVMPPTA